MSKMGSKGWRSGKSARLPPIWPVFRKSWRRLHTCVEFVVGSLICSERFFSWYSGFPLSSKTNISKFQFDQESGTRKLTKNHFVDVLPLNRGLFYLFYLFIYLKWSISSRSKLPVLSSVMTRPRDSLHCLCELTLFTAIKVTSYIEYTTLVVSSLNCTVRQYSCITCYTNLRNYVIAVRE